MTMTAEETRREKHRRIHQDTESYHPRPWDGEVTCYGCGRSWCDDCDGTHGPLCHWCHGRGYSTAPIRKLRGRP